MSDSTVTGNDWTLSVSQEWIPVVSNDPREPDPNWQYVDKQMHGHRYVEDDIAWSTTSEWSGRSMADAPEHYPTLRRMQSPPAADEPDDYVTWTECALCGEVIVPGTRSVDPVSHVRGPRTAVLSLDVQLSDADLRAVTDAYNANNRLSASDLLPLLGKINA